jgi:heterodisulfide reductase subunit C/nitrate reductase gamma subunit
MTKQIVFSVILLITLVVFAFTLKRLIALFKLTKPTEPLGNWGERISLTLKVAFGQTKILRKPVIGFIHALVFWGFLVITIGSIEMVIDGLFGTERALSKLGILYDIISASGDIFAYIVGVGIIIFLIRRLFMHINRFYGSELTPKNKKDANFALFLILMLMVSLAGMNIYYLAGNMHEIRGVYPVSSIIATHVSASMVLHEVFWWMHILLIFFFANYLPYSKHFHVFMSIPNVFISNLNPLTKLPGMESVTKEVKLMLSGDAFSDTGDTAPVRFGVKDIEDITWKNYFNSLTCTQCGRCTEVCPANITGKQLSPRKIFVDLRNRMNDKGLKLIKNSKYDDGKALVTDYISYEELWACTTCNACAQECPLNISHPNLIMDMRRYLVLEEGKAPTGINTMFANIENNGAPWQFSPEDRLQWAE